MEDFYDDTDFYPERIINKKYKYPGLSAIMERSIDPDNRPPSIGGSFSDCDRSLLLNYELAGVEKAVAEKLGEEI